LGVPLSEDEQRILHEIERQFYEQDPAFAREVSSTTLYTHAGRNLKWAAAAFVAGLAFMLFTFRRSAILGGIGFVMMVASAVFFEHNLRKMGKAGWHSMTRSIGAGGARTALGDSFKRARERFRRNNDEG
jgi:hypothetical protein